jgi:hypothetical protein
MRTGIEVWTYEQSLRADQEDWLGYSVHATDGDIGKIDEMTTATGRGSLVVDTGFWIFGKKRVIPAASVLRVDHDDKTVHVSLTKQQIKDAPDYDEATTSNDSTWDDYGRYYGRYL